MSEIKVNKISPKQTCTQVTLGDSGDDIIVASGVNFKTPSVKDASGNIIISRCGSNITIGSSGAAVALAAGATQSGFGPTGAVSWNTTKITADPNPAVSGVGYFADTTSSAFTVTLPAAPSAGDIVALSDYTGTWATNNLTVGRNSSNINGAAADLVLNGNNTTATLIYVDGTEGWRVIDTGSLSEVNVTPGFVAAIGGTVTCCGDYKIHTFTGPGTFTVLNAGNPVGSNSVDYLVVAGGAGGGARHGGGGGAGGYRESSGAASGCYTASPLGACVSALPVSVQGYAITVGAGGAAGIISPPGPIATPGGTGSNSVFSTITSAGGGSGHTASGTPTPSVLNGGSGGGGGYGNTPAGSGPTSKGLGNTPPVSPPQGNNGGTGSVGAPYDGGGGGGATSVGGPATAADPGGPGGTGGTTSISGSPTTYAGGGGGGSYGCGCGGTGGSGGGGTGGNGLPIGGCGTAGLANTGGGGGGTGLAVPAVGAPTVTQYGAAGGSGIVVIRYKYQ
jgi:hypothetical protein